MNPIFDPEIIHECSLAGIGKPKPAMFDAIADAMEQHYPGRINRDQPWIYSIAGGAMIQMKLYYASLYEYLMIWGTPIGSEGHSGRHAVGFWDTVIDGETWYYAEGVFEKRVFKPGDRIWVGPGQSCGMNFTDGVWAVEYARGAIPLSIPFGLADEVLSTVDFSTVARTLGVYAALIGHHWTLPHHDGSAAGLVRRTVGGLMASVAPRVNAALAPPPWTLEIPRGDRGTSSASSSRPRGRLSVVEAVAGLRKRRSGSGSRG